MTTLVPMTEAAYERFRARAVTDYAQENVAAERWPEQGSLARSEAAYALLLPQGLATPGQHLFTIRDESQASDVGVLWLAVTESPSGRAGYVYDVAIRPEHRRCGHARAAFIALEDFARAQGLREIGLHVFAHNPGAEALYRALGYRVTGLNMQKPLG